jgi:predicted SAM-dependent methyltransferase
MSTLRINIGCGDKPTQGWRNFDNSLSLRLAKVPFLSAVLVKLGLLKKEHSSFIQYCRNNSIEYGDAIKGLPVRSNSVDVIYSSHMLEHLDQQEVSLFLKEARRILCPGGIIRLAVPDLHMLVQKYIETKDADSFIASTLLTQPRFRTLSKRIEILVMGTRNHQWMYDGPSLSRLLLTYGFTFPRVLKAGESQIRDPQYLDLHERSFESVYVEATNP